MLYRFDNVEKSYGPHDVLKGVTWQHNPGQHVGLVGRNGAGKTTLFRLLLKQEEPDRGQILRSSGLTVGHVGQHLDAEPGLSLFDFVETAFAEVQRIERKMRAIEHDLADTTRADHERLLEKYAELQHDYEHADGYTLHAEVERVLTGVGFSDKSEWERPIHEFSGGQQNRAMLARVLLTRVDLLLLDEPTNHLDLKGIEFLEEFLQDFKGSYLLISHDRTFLNRTVSTIVELAHGKLVEYHGNYERFLQLRAERMEKMAKDYERQQEYIAETQEFIRRNLAGQKTKQAKSRRKMLDKLDEFERPETDETLAKFTLDGGARSGAVALTIDRISAGYGAKRVVTDFSWQIRRGERYAIMGPNGSGKSTLLKTLASRIAPLSGTVAYGQNVQIGYYDQTLGDLKPNGIVIDEVWDLDHTQTEEEVRSYLARFSFFGEDVFKKTRDLSGGEKGRLALAKIMYAGGNVMLLDEPTNHLDVYTREALEEALENFTGALIVVSHDRYFVDRVAENIIVVEEGLAEVYSGNYSELVARTKEGTAKPLTAPVIMTIAAPVAPPPKREEPAKRDEAPKVIPDRTEQRKRDKRIKKIDEEVAQLETRIAAAEAERERNDLLLCSQEVFRDGERVKKIQQQNHDLKAMIDLLYGKWESLAKEKEELEGAVA
ncbi:MAG: ABC-F family ATP-binding cassette domain-containing protein [Acidobacteria bacterium]|nr:ABC-F family ATP-binding cassette domain-containing protein [Acidobacteriota bacterium]MBV9476508.1 ABC-F family ATP-binding cassette domain-containing protein [Acidobacteriota bacterium]